MPESGAHLTTSRVNRLLRPLRNKCNSLAALPMTATGSRGTCSKQSSNWDPDSRLPLTVLPRPEGTKKLTIDKNSAGDFELSRRIYAVCDAFKNIAHVAFGQPCSDRIPSLAATCALVIGKNMHVATSDCIVTDSGEDSAEENDKLDEDAIYEAVPPHYRRYLVVSHALDVILCICTHHHTLVTVLLDHCLWSGLVHESTHLLNIILAQAFLPSSLSYPPPTTHLAHTNYLLDLHVKWTTANNSSGKSTRSLLFTTSTFCQAVLRALSQSSSSNSRVLWTSEVLNRLLNAIKGCDVDSYIVVICALSRSFWETLGSSPDEEQDDTQLMLLRDKLSELMSSLFNLLFIPRDSHSPPLTPSRVNATIDMLFDCYAVRLHCSRMSKPASFIDLPDMIIIFATHIFVVFRNSISSSDHLLTILADSSPVPTTFSKLMVYFSRLQEGQTLTDFLEGFLAELRKYSSTLCSVKLFRLDASFWACALHHFETSVVNSQMGSSTLVTKYKQRLMESVDAAERRCFGGNMDNNPIIPFATCSRGAKYGHRSRLSGHWEWEDVVGSWIRMTPVHKKRKIEHGRPRDATILEPVSGSVSTSTPLSTCHRRLSTLSASSSNSRFSESESPVDDGSEYQDEADKENCPTDPPPVTRQSRITKHRNSSFFSLLADAQANRILLHSEPCSERRPPPSTIPEKYVLPFTSQGSRHAPRKQERKPSRIKVTPALMPSGTLLPSDDSLDLFAYATSSPSRSWFKSRVH